MRKDGVTLNPDMTNCATDYGRRCQSIGMERHSPQDLDSAMSHPQFKERHHVLLDGLAKEYEASRPVMERAPWKTIQLGTHRSNQQLRKALTSAGFPIGNWASDILKKVDVALAPTEVDLVLVTVADLGFTKATPRSAIYDKALGFGLELCPAEVGPQLRLQYPDQPKGEWIYVGMEPIADSDGGPLLFFVGRDGGGRWLAGDCDGPGITWFPGDRWVFVRRK